jgi:molybdenum cofactor sulfurtransferase
MWFECDEPMSFLDLRDRLSAQHGPFVGATRVSVGLATNFTDVYRFMCFIQQLVDRTVTEIGRTDFMIDDGQSLAA